MTTVEVWSRKVAGVVDSMGTSYAEDFESIRYQWVLDLQDGELRRNTTPDDWHRGRVKFR